MSTCQYCQTELKNKRQKSCAACAARLDKAHRAGNYQQVLAQMTGQPWPPERAEAPFNPDREDYFG